MMDDIIELHRALQEAQGLDTTTKRYKIRMAKVQDIRALSEGNDCYYDSGSRGNKDSGLDSAKIAEILNLPIEMVEIERARIDRHNQMRRRFLASGDLDLTQLPNSPTVFTIFQR